MLMRYYEEVINFFFFLVDIDECSVSSSICSNGFCENFMGGYQCTCFEGYHPNTQKTACLGNTIITVVRQEYFR